MTWRADGALMNFATFFARLFIHRGRFFRQGMHTAMDVGIRVAVELVHRLDHRQRFLAGGGRIQVDQRHARAHFSLQDRKILPDALDIKMIGLGGYLRSWIR